jgi:hypothetical protein
LGKRAKLIDVIKEARELRIESSGIFSPPAQPEAQSPAPGSRLRSVFIGANGLRAGWRLAIFVALFDIFTFVVFGLLRFIPGFASPCDALRARPCSGSMSEMA